MLPVDGEVVIESCGGDGRGLNEIVQTKSVKFAFLTKADKEGHFRRFHPLVKCRDYLSDILHCKAFDRNVSIYGIELEAHENLLDTEITRFLIDLPAADAAERFVHNFPFVQEFGEKHIGIPPARLFAVAGSSKRFVFEGDPYWQKSTQLTSLITFLCRITLYMDTPTDNWLEIPKKASGVDASYIEMMVKHDVMKTIKYLKKLNYDKSPSPSGFSNDEEIDTLHNYSGILNFVTGGAPWGTSEMQKNVLYKQMQQLLA